MTATPVPTPRAELTAQRTPLIGRVREITAVAELLLRDDVPVVTLIGLGGVGKTRLALQIGADLNEEFAGGVRFVDLAPLNDPDLVAMSIASVLGIREVVDQPLADRLRAALAAQRLLLILDNFEHLLPAAPLIGTLLAAESRSKVLVTSRERLHIYGEHICPVEPLRTPTADAESPLDLSNNEAAHLFVERARAVKPDFALTEFNAPAVAEICRRLDGLPLAIELASAWTRILTPAAMLKRLEKRLGILTGGPSDVPERQQTMRATIAWSYDLLTESEQALFRRLAVFVGSCRLDEATAVGTAAGALDIDVFDLVASLIDKNLLAQTDSPDGEFRFRMFETLREFGLEQLIATDEEVVSRSAYAATYLELALSLKTLSPPMWLLSFEAISRLAAEQDNIRAAMSWFELVGDSPRLLRLAIQLGGPWYFAPQFRDVQRWLERALELAPDATLLERGFAHLFLGFYDAYRLGLEPAIAHLEQSRAVAREVGYPWLEAVSVGMLGIFAQARHDHATAEARFAEAVELGSAIDPTLGPLMTYHRANVAYAQGNAGKAANLWESALATGRRLHRPQLIAWCLVRHAMMASEQGDPAGAAHMIREFLALGPASAYRYMSSGLLVTVAALAEASGEPQRAARLLGSSATANETTDQGFVLFQDSVDRLMFRARDALGPEAFDRLYAEGRMMRPSQVADEISAVLDVGEAWETPRESESAAPFGLTIREIDVLRLLVEGRSNPQIAEALFISPRTVQTHLTSCYGKLNVSGRAEAVAITVRHNIT
jgi:predicted ATPase/DNA-binding CsgD family transcriptional regulator